MTEEVIEEADEHHVYYELLGMEFHTNQLLGILWIQWKCLKLVTKWTTTIATVAM